MGTGDGTSRRGRMRQMISNIIRFVLSCGLLYGAYIETGFWTVVNLALIMVAMEVGAWNQKKMLRNSE